MKNMTYISGVSFVSIFSAVMITMIGVGVQANGVSKIKATVDTDLFHAFTAVTNIVFAYCAHVAFFGLLAEMKNPRDFPKALYMLQAFEIIFYTVAAVVIYYYAVPCSRIRLASIEEGCLWNCHSNYCWCWCCERACWTEIYLCPPFPRNGSDAPPRSRLCGSWFAIGLTCWIIAWIIADAIPVFSDLLGLISSLFASWFSYGLGGVYWLHLNWGRWFSSSRNICLTILNMLIVLIGACMCGLGLYVAGKAIHDDASSNSFSRASNA
ncbi:uncharacterized protein N7482_005083 [Penicillium canariense]|uniref:Amino acid transporter transmembrane domain-containing protein n=1 Tax=Penicillium canariense TaxID=189055 RepID=A0A9W9LM97_9EURO|nr:uncharacterized protein N7482_005083 [Penicillium canariense]KAJ5166302.1 hypothetical protein N7482_005083 [Penicillium canariense]